MIIEIEHLKNNKFKIMVNGQESFYAGKAWFNSDLFLNNTYIITNKDDKILYYAEEEKLHNYCFYNENKEIKWHINKKEIQGENNILTCYEKATGIFDNILIYDDNNQIGQVIIPQNPGKMYLFLLDGLENFISVLALYTIICDCFSLWELRNSIGRSTLGFKYTYSKEDKYYDENWINKNFNQKDVKNIFDNLKMEREIKKEKEKNSYKILLPIIGIIILLLIVILFILKKIISYEQKC